jgi:hypothetical protein
MNSMKKYCIFFIIFLVTNSISAQERVKKIEFYGNARTNLLHQSLEDDKDTLNPTKANYGHSLIDLGVLIRPSSKTEIITELRMRNEFGGFYGGAVTFGIRRLTLKGVVNNAIRYKVGDIDLKLTPYTLFNNGYQDVVNEATVFDAAREVVDYEHFFGDNQWRRQGLQTEFGFIIDQSIFKDLNFNLFMTRNNAANPGTNTPEQLLSGSSIGLTTDYGHLNFNTSYLHDLKNTVTDLELFYNLVNTVSAEINLPQYPNMSIVAETGMSSEAYEDVLNETTDEKVDVFYNAGLKFNHSKKYTAQLNSMYTGPVFRSVSAQNIRLNNSSSSQIFPVVNNNQLRQMGLMDYLYNDVQYNKTLDNSLDIYNPVFSNVLPYGLATPNRTGFSAHVSNYQISDKIDLDAKAYMLSEVVGSGTTELKSFLSAEASINLNYQLFQVNAGVKMEKTSRDGADYETIDLQSILIDFGFDFNLTDNITLLYGSKIHYADGNELMPSFDNTNYFRLFEPINFDEEFQTLNALGVKVGFSEKSTLTISASSFVQYKDINYQLNQFNVLYKLNF